MSVVIAGALLIIGSVLMMLNPRATFAPDAMLGLLLPAALIVTAMVTWAIAALAARHLLARGQPASTVTELAWDDALRAFSLRAVNEMPAAIGWIGAFIAAVTFSSSANWDRLSGLSGLSGFGDAVASIPLVVPLILLSPVVVILLVRGRRPPHYLRQLWPETAAQIVANPGETGPIIVVLPSGGSQ